MQEERRTVTVPFAPRPWQAKLINDKSKRIVAVIHRRAGKSTALMWMGIRRAVTETKPLPRVAHILPYSVMWTRTGLWDQLVKASESMPGVQVRRSEMVIRFPNGGVFQAGGADHQDSWRGSHCDFCVLDEYDDHPASMVPLVVEPMLADRDGTLIRSGTPKGNGVLQAAYERSKVTPGHSVYLLDYTKTGALSDEAIERLKIELQDDEFLQELCCSFNAPHSGSYYGKLIDEAERAGRIGDVPYEPKLPVWTSWDLGISDSTAIWFAQLGPGGEWRLIDYIEDSGAALDHYVGLIEQRPYTRYAMHLLPHDAAVKELGSGLARTETLHRLGLRPWRIVRQHNVADGINAVRLMLAKAWIDATKCAQGIKALRHYRREWNEAGQAWRQSPVHDWASHSADSARYMALGVRQPAVVSAPERQKDSWEKAWEAADRRQTNAWKVA